MGIEQSWLQKEERLEIEYNIEEIEYNTTKIPSYPYLQSNSKYLAGKETNFSKTVEFSKKIKIFL